MAGLRLRLRIGRRPYKAPRRGFQVRGASQSPRGARLFETLCRSVCHSKRSSNGCAPPDHSSRELTRTLCKHFTSVSPGMSGHKCHTDRAPMLVGTPLPVILSVFVALGPALWIRKALPLLPQPLRHAAMMRTGPLARSAEAECPVSAVGCSPGGRLAIRSPRGRWDPLALGIDVAAALRRCRLRCLGAEKFFEQVAGELRNRDAAPALGAAVEPDGGALRQHRQRARRRERLLPQPNGRSGVSECVLG